ncbi:glutamine ABC transporter substrate-binding protein [Paenibacillus sp. CCS19]|uniref:transporter substrate-binding domain-containing protein n=1 Tax=Paenibacillus sp. CCS19 TaxID=3158387 RepID=UPI00256263ED|nr:transporter substrate-binding domain-containing protein [Paenibacillus cellulosilyticus]GMK40844.1 glutamine ABC transporter substrate-binding protein [Paenibacillus cellulosilyticus]
MKRSYTLKSALLLLVAIMLVVAGCSKKEETAPGAADDKSTTASASRLDAIKEKGKLVIATGDYYPFEYLDADTKKLVGYDIDLGQKIADKLGVQVEWKEMQFTALIPTIQNGQADMAIAAMYITDERKKAVDMSEIYMKTGMSLVKREGDESINSLEDLKGKKVGVKAGATSETAAKELIEQGYDIKIVSYKDTTDYLLDLQMGRVDAAINDYLNQLGYNKQHAEAKLSIVGEPFTEAGLGLAVKQGDTELLQLANDVIKELDASGEAKSMYEKWLK